MVALFVASHYRSVRFPCPFEESPPVESDGGGGGGGTLVWAFERRAAGTTLPRVKEGKERAVCASRREDIRAQAIRPLLALHDCNALHPTLPRTALPSRSAASNSPNDLQMMSDAPAHNLFVLLGPVDESSNALPEILCTVQVGHRCPPTSPRACARSFPAPE